MSDYIDWLRPSGSTIKTKNTESLNNYAESNGWKILDNSEEAKECGLAVSHEETINGMTEKTQVLDYIDGYKITIDGRGGLEIIKKKAIQALNDM